MPANLRFGAKGGDPAVRLGQALELGADSHCVHHSRIAEQLKTLRAFYPDVDQWYWSRVVPGVAAGTRKIIVQGNHHLDGFVILKNDGREKKICTLWVDPFCRRQGIATDLLEEAQDWLLTKCPLITVPEERMVQLAPFLGDRGYQLTGSLNGYYRRGRREFVFNDLLHLMTL